MQSVLRCSIVLEAVVFVLIDIHVTYSKIGFCISNFMNNESMSKILDIITNNHN